MGPLPLQLGFRAPLGSGLDIPGPGAGEGVFQSGLPAGAGSQAPGCSQDKVTGIELG